MLKKSSPSRHPKTVYDPMTMAPPFTIPPSPQPKKCLNSCRGRATSSDVKLLSGRAELDRGNRLSRFASNKVPDGEGHQSLPPPSHDETIRNSEHFFFVFKTTFLFLIRKEDPKPS